MLSLIAFIAGVLMLIKGSFRLFNRSVNKRDGRLAGAVLMAPFAFEICLVFTISFSMVNESMMVSEDGSVSISSQVLEAYVNQMADYSNLFLATVAVAVVVAALIIFRSPQVKLPSAPTFSQDPSGSAPPTPTSKSPPSTPSARPPREHPLGGFGAFSPVPAPKPAAPKAVMTIAEAAAYISKTPAEVERLIDENRLPAARGPGGYRIARSALDDLMNGTL